MEPVSNFIHAYFNLSELEKLCIRLNINFNELAGEVETDKIASLLLYVGRHRLFKQLLAQLKHLRPILFQASPLEESDAYIAHLNRSFSAFERQATGQSKLLFTSLAGVVVVVLFVFILSLVYLARQPTVQELSRGNTSSTEPQNAAPTKLPSPTSTESATSTPTASPIPTQPSPTPQTNAVINATRTQATKLATSSTEASLVSTTPFALEPTTIPPLTTTTAVNPTLAPTKLITTTATLTSTRPIDPSPATSIFNNSNTETVTNSPTNATQFTIEQPHEITQLWTYHWHDGQGAVPASGHILQAANGINYGPWTIETSSGEGGAPNVNWNSYPNTMLPAGTYTIIDPDPATWAHNEPSDQAGFAQVWGQPLNLGDENQLFDNSNIFRVVDGPPQPTRFTLTQPHVITYVWLYHWNNGRGTVPSGGLRFKAADGVEYGPWKILTSSDVQDTPHVNWSSFPGVLLPPGTYTVVDPDWETWSYNGLSGNAGFTRIMGQPIN